jgi:hypothetical protein
MKKVRELSSIELLLLNLTGLFLLPFLIRLSLPTRITADNIH